MLKRAFDLAVSGTGIIVTMPVVAPIALVMAFQTKSWPFFTQDRVGKHGNSFKIYKIRSMNDKVDNDGLLLDDEARTSKLGSVLRKSRLDELPNLVNVFKGDMSIVGPRPVVKLIQQIANDHERHTVRPGITGLAQIAGQNNLSDSRTLELDKQYVRNHDLPLDIKICALTIPSLIKNWHAPHYNAKTQSSLIDPIDTPATKKSESNHHTP